MKKHIKSYIVIATLSGLLFSNCSNLLEENPLNQVSVDNFYNTEADAIASLNAAYGQLKSNNGYYRQQFISNIFASSDQGSSSWKHGNFRKGTIVDTDQNLPNTWNEIYVAIKDANNTIHRVPTIEEMDTELQNRIIGEAKFLRALNYFNLVRCFGEVPLRTKPVKAGEGGLPIAPLNEIYSVIIEDLKFATQNCWGFNETRANKTNDIGRATKTAAHAMLAKVYLQIASSKRTALEGNAGNKNYLKITESPLEFYTLAKEQCDLAIGDASYQLVNNLADWIKIFDPKNGNNPEMIFEIQGSSIVGQGTSISNLFSPRDAGLSGGGWGGTNKFQPGFINKNMDKTDVRFQNSIIRQYQDITKTYNLNNGSTGYVRTITETGAADGNQNIVFTMKYIDPDATTEYTSQQNWHVVRLADVYLMRAEAMVEISQNTADGNADINALRNRVGMVDFDGSGLSMTQFRSALLGERSAELSMEGHRFFDLTRLGVYNEYCVSSYGKTNGKRDPEDYTWPIPLSETSANENIN